MNTYICPRCKQLVPVGETCKCETMKTAMQELIEKYELLQEENFPLYSNGLGVAIKEAQKQLPKEREQIEQGWKNGYTQGVSDSVDFEKGKTPPDNNASDYFTQTYKQ